MYIYIYIYIYYFDVFSNAFKQGAIIISNTTFYPSLTIASKEPRFIAKETLF
jgi:hypothetical protein